MCCWLKSIELSGNSDTVLPVKPGYAAIAPHCCAATPSHGFRRSESALQTLPSRLIFFIFVKTSKRNCLDSDLSCNTEGHNLIKLCSKTYLSAMEYFHERLRVIPSNSASTGGSKRTSSTSLAASSTAQDRIWYQFRDVTCVSEIL